MLLLVCDCRLCALFNLSFNLQLCYIVRLLDVRAALDTLPDKQRRAAAEQQLSAGSSSGLLGALNHAAGLVAKLRDSSGYRWVDLGVLFSRLRAGRRTQQGGPAAGGSRGGSGGGLRA